MLNSRTTPRLRSGQANQCAAKRSLPEGDGFSILEIIVAIVMIGIMLAVALPKYNRVVEKSRQSEAFTNLAAIRASQARYYAENGEWTGDWAGAPDDFENLDAEGPEDPEQYFTYYTGDPEFAPVGAPDDAVAFAERKEDVKNCCFGEYRIFISTAGKITKCDEDDNCDSGSVP